MKSQALPLTRAEATDYRETTRSAEVLTFMDELCAATPLAKRLSLGTSSQGQDIAALVISDRQCFTPELALASADILRKRQVIEAVQPLLISLETPYQWF